MQQFRISAKNLAQLNVPGHCKSCFWHLTKIRNKPPYSIFPGIFSSFDRIQKLTVERHFEDTDAFPTWLGPMADATGIADTPARMELIHSETDIVLVGLPDHVFEWADGKVSPIDYKTARFTKGQDELKPLYEGQLEAYAFLLKETCDRDSEKAALVYFEPKGDKVTITKEGFSQPWIVNVVELKISGQRAVELLVEARDIFDRSTPPNGRAECRDCELVEKLVSVAAKPAVKQSDILPFLTPKEFNQHVATDRYRRISAKSASHPRVTEVQELSQGLLMEWDWR
jgi:PD-(D/E)XK nuclease superfamily